MTVVMLGIIGDLWTRVTKTNWQRVLLLVGFVLMQLSSSAVDSGEILFSVFIAVLNILLVYVYLKYFIQGHPVRLIGSISLALSISLLIKIIGTGNPQLVLQGWVFIVLVIGGIFAWLYLGAKRSRV